MVIVNAVHTLVMALQGEIGIVGTQLPYLFRGNKIKAPKNLVGILSKYLDSSVQGSTGKGVVVLWVDDNLHDIVSVALKDLLACPVLIPVPQFDGHVI